MFKNWARRILGHRNQQRPVLMGLLIVALLGLAFSSGTEAASNFALGRSLGEPAEPAAEPQRQLTDPEDSDNASSQLARIAADGIAPASAADAVVVGASPKTRSESIAVPSGEGDSNTAEALAYNESSTSQLETSDTEPAGVDDPSDATGTEPATAPKVQAPSTTAEPASTNAPAPKAPPATTQAPTTTTAPATTQAPTTTKTPATTKAPTTTKAPAPAKPVSANAVLSAPIEGMSAFGFGQSKSTVTKSLESQFGSLVYSGDANWDDFAVVNDPSGDYIRTRSNVGNNSRKQFNARIPVAKETYLVYRFYLEPGFDAGDGNGSEGSPSWGTGIKMPGLMRGNPVANTGGNHTAGGFSGRLMIRGTRKSDGEASSPRQGLTLAAYVYGQKIDGQSIASGYGEDYYFLNGFGAKPFEGINNGTHEGVGDPRIWDLQVGKWTTVVLGYRVDGDNGWFKAWTMTDGGSLQPRLHIPRVNWMGNGGEQGADSMIFQQYWGGSGSVWHPDSVSHMRFKDFGVYNSEAAALAAAR